MTATGPARGYDALDLRPVRRWLSGPEPRAVLAPQAVEVAADGRPAGFVDRYLDTADWRLYRAGLALRLRSGAEGWSAALDPLRPELAGRLPPAEPWPDGAEALDRAAGPVADRVRAVAGRRPLRDLFEVSTQRERFQVRLGPAPAGSVQLEARTIGFGPAAAPVDLRRVVLEPTAAGEPAMKKLGAALAEACGLRSDGLDVFQAALLTAGLVPLEPPPPVDRRVGPGSTVGEVAFAALERGFGVLVTKEPGTRLGDDPEELHDMRVATRRMRAAMKLFEPALPAVAPRLRTELGWLAEALGVVRDIDVQLAQLDAWISERPPSEQPPLGALSDVLAARRRRARSRLLAVLDSRRYERLLARFARFLAHGPVRRSPAANAPVTAVAPELLGAAYRRAIRPAGRLTPESPPPEFHRVRIRCKRLRYALEFLTPVYGAPAHALAKRLAAVQDVLGRHQDDQVAIGQLREIAAGSSRRLSGLALFEMGEIAERYARDASRQRKRFKRVLRQLRGKPWHDLQRQLEQRRPIPHAGRGVPGATGDPEPAAGPRRAARNGQGQAGARSVRVPAPLDPRG